jgi:hypothetical protein
MGLRTVKPEDIFPNNNLLLAKDNVLVRIRATYLVDSPRVGYTTSCDAHTKWRWTSLHNLIFYLNNEFGGIVT